MIKYKGFEFPYIYMEDVNGVSSIIIIIDETLRNVCGDDLKKFKFEYDNNTYGFNQELISNQLFDNPISLNGKVPEFIIEENINDVKNIVNNFFKKPGVIYSHGLVNNYDNWDIDYSNILKFIYYGDNGIIPNTFTYFKNIKILLTKGLRIYIHLPCYNNDIDFFKNFNKIPVVFLEQMPNIPLFTSYLREIRIDSILNSSGEYTLKYNNNWLETIEYDDIYALGLSLINNYSFTFMCLYNNSFNWKNLKFSNKMKKCTLLEIFPLLFSDGRCMWFKGKLNGRIPNYLEVFKNGIKLNFEEISMDFEKLYKKYNKI